MIWQEVIDNPLLDNLPFKIELNKYGQILMSPASNKHGIIQIEVALALAGKKMGGRVISECSIETSEGVKVADIAWTSDEFMQRHGDTTPYPQAPELCVEIVSPSNTGAEISNKVDLYLAQGAKEVWIITEDRKITFYAHGGEIRNSELVPDFQIG
ncbi:MAG: Uma2 family endonuclease [Pirellulales bacterium]|nr:Uma2 family endonuclease [Pirellulales bacterium]